MLKRTTLLSFLVCVTVLVNSCRDRDAELEQALIETVKKGIGTVFLMRDITPFEWDRMYVFQPYTTSAEINRRLGFEWSGAKSSGIEMFDSIKLLVFVKDKEVVADVVYKVWNGNFIEDGSHGYRVEEAKFRVADEWQQGEKLLMIRKVQ